MAATYTHITGNAVETDGKTPLSVARATSLTRGPDFTTIEQLNEPVGLATNATKTPIFICTLEKCFRLLPDKAKLLLHRARDHHMKAPQQDVWHHVVTWPEIMRRELALETAAKKRLEARAKEPTPPLVDIYDFDGPTDAAPEPAAPVDHVRASYLPLATPAPANPAYVPWAATTPASVVPQKREAEAQGSRADATVEIAESEDEEMAYEPPEPESPSSSHDDAGDSPPYEPALPSPSPEPVTVPQNAAVDRSSDAVSHAEATEGAPSPQDTTSTAQARDEEITSRVPATQALSPPTSRLLPPSVMSSSSSSTLPAIPGLGRVPSSLPARPMLSASTYMPSLPSAVQPLVPRTSSYERSTFQPPVATAVASSVVYPASAPVPRAAPQPDAVSTSGPERRFIPRDELPARPLPRSTEAKPQNHRAAPASSTDIKDLLAKLRAPPPAD